MKTEAHKRTVFQELPDAFSIQLLRFSNEGKKVKTFVEYPGSLKVEQVTSEGGGCGNHLGGTVPACGCYFPPR